MSTREKLKKIGSLALGAACVFLVFKLISEISGSPVEAARGQETAARSSSNPPRSSKPLRKEISKLASADPGLEFQALKEYTTRPLPENTRDPFDFPAPPLSPTQRGGRGIAGGGIGAGAAPAPPQISLRALGYSMREGVGGEAYLADSDQVYVVHQGNLVSKRYMILKITPSAVEVKDESSGETVHLPIPQAE